MTTIRRDMMIESADADSETFQQVITIFDKAVEDIWKLGYDVRVEQKRNQQREYKKTYVAARAAEVRGE